MTRSFDLFSTFGHLQQFKLAQKCHNFAKVGSAFSQIRNKQSKICQRLVNFCQSGEISPNLVTLLPSDNCFSPSSTDRPSCCRHFCSQNFLHFGLSSFIDASDLPLRVRECECDSRSIAISKNNFLKLFKMDFTFAKLFQISKVLIIGLCFQK